MEKVTDPNLINQLESSLGEKVTDPNLISQLEGKKPEQHGNWFVERAKDVGRFVSDPRRLGRTAFQVAGATAGGILGAPVGGIGGIVGGGLGYAFGDKLADIIYGERLPPEEVGKPIPQLKQTAKDIGTGMLYETGGKVMELGGRGLFALENATREMLKGGVMPWMTGKLAKVAEKEAAKKIAATTTTAVPAVESQIEKNIRAAEGLETEIPGLRFNIGQQTGDPNLLSLTRAQSQTTGVGPARSVESVMGQNEALRNYITQHIRGGGNIDDFMSVLRGEQTRLAKTSETAIKGAETEATKISGRGEQEIGEELLKKLQLAKELSGKKAKALYENIPETLRVDATPLWKKVDELFGGFDALTQRLGTTPTGPMTRIREAMKPKILGPEGKPIRITPTEEMPAELTMRQMKDFRSQISTAQRAAITSNDPDKYTLAYKLGQLKEGVNDTLTKAVETGEETAVRALKTATEYWRGTHVPKFRHGETGKILRIKGTGEQMISDASIPGRYFLRGREKAADAADEFNFVFRGDPEAKAMMKDYAAMSLLNVARNKETGELSSRSISRWLYDHDVALTKLGLKKDFADLRSATKLAEEARGIEAAFNKSSLGRALTQDPDRAIATVLMTGTGRKQSIQRLQEMVRLAKKDKSGGAIEGLKAGIGDYFRRQTSVVARDLAGNKLESLAKMDRFLDEFRPAFKLSGLYTPAELKAFDNVHKTIQIVAQQQRPTAGFIGSPTAEILQRLGGSGASVIFRRWGAYGLTRSAMSLADRFLKDEVDKALAKAVFDPRYAAVISGLVYNVKKLPAQQAIRRFTQQISALGLMTYGGLMQEIPVEQKETPKSYEMGPRASTREVQSIAPPGMSKYER